MTPCQINVLRTQKIDRIDHWLLFKKLISKDVPLFIIRLLVVSSSFGVSNSVKQGGILSPTSFNIYIDSLSTSLNSTNIRGHTDGQLLKHLCYADDLCMISMSSAGMQCNICKDYAEQHSLHYNGSKSFSMCFKSEEIKYDRPDVF